MSKDQGTAEKADEEPNSSSPFKVMGRKALKERDVTVLRRSALRTDLERGIHPTKGTFVYKLFYFCSALLNTTEFSLC